MISTTLPWITEQVLLSTKLFYRTGGIAKYYATPQNLLELQKTLHWAQAKALEIIVVGEGSNSVFSDTYFSGVVISLAYFNKWYFADDNTLCVDPGVTNTEIAAIALDKSWNDAHWMHKLPGQIGATVRMNARCYGFEISQIVQDVLCLDYFGNISLHSGKDFFMGYKQTLAMQQACIVVAVRLHFKDKQNSNTILQKMQTCETDRNNKHHFDFPSCGSTFKNDYTIGVPCGQIFDELNLKGCTRGGAAISKYHANFIFNQNQATANDILELAAHMRETAYNKRNFLLNLELEPLGEFDNTLLTRCGIKNNNSNKSSIIGTLLYKNTELAYPKNMLHSFFTEYFQTQNAAEHRVTVKLEQLLSLAEAKANPQVPFLQWTTLCNTAPANIFTESPPAKGCGFIDELWKYSVSEIFLGRVNSSRYFEFEITPQQHWIAIAFLDKREREHSQVDSKYWRGVNTFAHDNNFGMTFCYEQLQLLIYDNCITAQCCLSMGNNKYFLAPHWCDTQADFHQPQRFFCFKLF